MVSVLDMDNDFENVNAHHFQFYGLSNNDLLTETQLGSKSILKQKIKNDFFEELEFDGYIETINNLIEDLIELVNTDLPIQHKKFDIEALIKLLSVDFLTEGESDYEFVYNRLLKVLPLVTNTILKISKGKPLLVYFYPEHQLSPRQQVKFKEMLVQYSKKLPVVVLSKSRYFLSDRLFSNNLIMNGKQFLMNNFLDDIEWNAPLNYSREELELTFSEVFKKYAVNFETYPIISNYKIADIQVFNDIQLYVLLEFMKGMEFEYHLDLDHSQLNPILLKYIDSQAM